MRILIEDQAHCCGYELECMVKLFFQAASVPAEWAEKATPQPQEEYLYAGASVVEQGEGDPLPPDHEIVLRRPGNRGLGGFRR